MKGLNPLVAEIKKLENLRFWQKLNSFNMFTFQKSGFSPTPVSQSIATLDVDVNGINTPTSLMDSSHVESFIASGSNDFVNLNKEEISPVAHRTYTFEQL